MGTTISLRSARTLRRPFSPLSVFSVVSMVSVTLAVKSQRWRPVANSLREKGARVGGPMACSRAGWRSARDQPAAKPGDCWISSATRPRPNWIATAEPRPKTVTPVRTTKALPMGPWISRPRARE
jgi:hypothetical protein